MMWRRVLSLVPLVMLCLASLAWAKPFDTRHDGVGVYLGEVECYGEHEIHPKFMEGFRIKLQENMQELQSQGKIHILGDWITGSGNEQEKKLLTDIHMDVIAYAPLFQKDMANAKMIRYAESVFGEDYFWDDNKLEARRAGAKKPYRISQAMTDAARDLGQKNGAEYIFFCNVQEVDFDLANSIFNAASSNQEERAKHIKFETSAYLMNTKTGKVYESHILTEKTGRIQNLFGQYGKAMTAETLLEAMFDMQAKKIVKDVFDNGKKLLDEKG